MGNLKGHINDVHIGVKQFVCKLCNFETTRKYTLKQHVDCVHNDSKPQKCKFCAHAFRWNSQLINHVKNTHATDKQTKDSRKQRKVTETEMPWKQQILNMKKEWSVAKIQNTKVLPKSKQKASSRAEYKEKILNGIGLPSMPNTPIFTKLKVLEQGTESSNEFVKILLP